MGHRLVLRAVVVGRGQIVSLGLRLVIIEFLAKPFEHTNLIPRIGAKPVRLADWRWELDDVLSA